MKKVSICIGLLGFVLGILTFFVWKEKNYVSIPRTDTYRSLATAQMGQQLVIDDFTEKIVTMRKSGDVDRVVRYITENAKRYPTFVGVQIFSSVAEILPLLKGIAWRLRGIVEDTDITHSVILSRLRFFYYSRYAYGPHIRALFHYLIYPQGGDVQFKKISDFQNFLTLKIRPKLKSILNRAQQSLALPAENHHFSFDRRIFLGHDENKRFFDPAEAKKEFIKPYVGHIIAALARGVGAMDYLSAYNVDDLTQIMRKLLKKSAINKIVGRFRIRPRSDQDIKSLPNIISGQEVVEIIKSFERFGTPRVSLAETQKLLDESYEMFALSAEHELKSYVCSIKYAHMMMSNADIPRDYDCRWEFMEAENFQEEEYFVVGGSLFLVDPNRLLINHRQKFHRLRDRYRIYHPGNSSGVVEITSDATGAVVRIRAQSAYTAKRDLKFFLPTRFSNSMNYDGISIDNAVGAYNDRGQWAWNFDYGRPIAWNSKAITFDGLFPDATNANIYDIMYSVRLTRSLRPFSNIFTTVP